jgi:hypothetical protein
VCCADSTGYDDDNDDDTSMQYWWNDDCQGKIEESGDNSAIVSLVFTINPTQTVRRYKPARSSGVRASDQTIILIALNTIYLNINWHTKIKFSQYCRK